MKVFVIVAFLSAVAAQTKTTTLSETTSETLSATMETMTATESSTGSVSMTVDTATLSLGTATETATPTDTWTSTATFSFTMSRTLWTNSMSPTVSETVSPTFSLTATASISLTDTYSLSVSLPTATVTGTDTYSASLSSSISLSHTFSVSLTLPTSTVTDSQTATYSLTATFSESSSVSASLTNTFSVTVPTVSDTFTLSLTATESLTNTVSMSLPTLSQTVTASYSVPTATESISLTLPTGTESYSLSHSRTLSFSLSVTHSESLTWSATPTFSISLTDTFSPSLTYSLSHTDTVSESLTLETSDNYTASLLPSVDFMEGQELRAVTHTMLGDNLLQSYYNYSDQVQYDFRVYEYNAALGRKCGEYILGTAMFRDAGFGLSVSDHLLENKTFVGSAFTTFIAPHHSVQFVMCFRQSRTWTDKEGKLFPVDGKWQMATLPTGQYYFQARPTRIFYHLPEKATPGQFVVMKLTTYEEVNFSTPLNCTSDVNLMQIQGANNSWIPWECLTADNVKIVPKNSSCTFESKDNRYGHPYLGTYYIGRDGSWDHIASIGLFEGATKGGVGLLSTPKANPFRELSQLPEVLTTAHVYIQLPVLVGEYDVCFSSARQRKMYTGYPYPEDIPVWQKLYACSQRVDKCSPASTDRHISVVAEDISWTILDLTPLSWGTMRIVSSSPDLNRLPAIPAYSDNVHVEGGDWVRIVQDHEFVTEVPKLDVQPLSTIGSFSPPGCWAPLDPDLEERAETSAVYAHTSRDLTDNPHYIDAFDDISGVQETYLKMRVPQKGETWYVCYRRGGWAAWRMLVWTPETNLPKMWRRLGSGYSPSVLSPTPVVPGWYGSTPALYHNVSLEWAMNDTRTGTWGPLVIRTVGGSTLSAEPNTAVRHRWEWGQSNLVDLRGTALRLTPLNYPCDMNSNLTSTGHWEEYLDSGTDECTWYEVETNPMLCKGSSSNATDVPAVNFYISVPAIGDYQVCVRIGALNWVAVPATETQNPHHYQSHLTVDKAAIFYVEGSLFGGTDAALQLHMQSEVTVGMHGDYTRIAFNKEGCDLIPGSWFGRQSEYDVVLSVLCDEGNSYPCSDPLGRYPPPKGVARSSIMTNLYQTGVNGAVTYFSVKHLNSTKSPPRLCYKSSLTTHWLSQEIPLLPFQPHKLYPPPSTDLLAGSLIEFRLTITIPHPEPFHAKMVPEGTRSPCVNIAAGLDTPPYSLSQTSTAMYVNGYFSFFIEMPVLPGAYFLCVSINETMVWKKEKYTVVDHGIRWHAKSEEKPVNQGVSVVWVERCRGTNCHVSDTLNTNPQGDAAKLVVWNTSCEVGSHIGLEGGGVEGRSDLGPTDGPQKNAMMVTTFPSTVGDVSVGYKVCVKTSIGGSHLWVAVPEDVGAPGQYFIGGMFTGTSMIHAYDVHPHIGPVTGSTEPTGLAGALTTFISDIASPDPYVAAGMWLIPSQQVTHAIHFSDVDFKLVPWPLCDGLDEPICERSGWCNWEPGNSRCVNKKDGVDCRAAGHPSTIIPSQSCIEAMGTCPSISTEWPLPDYAPKGSIGLRFHLPEPGRYLVCARLTSGPWRWLSNGRDTQTLLVVDPLLQMDPGPVSFDNPGSNVTLYDLHGKAGVSLSSWCGRNANEPPNCTVHYQPPMRKDWVMVVNDTQVCVPSLHPSEYGWVPVVRTGSASAAVAPGAQFRLPPSDPTPSGQYRVCALKASYAKTGSVPIGGAISQPGVSYTLWNRASPALGTGGSTSLLVAGQIDQLAVTVGSTFDTSRRFNEWSADMQQYYEGQDVLIDGIDSKSVVISAGEIVTITINALSSGQKVGVGGFPVSIETCEAYSWSELTCTKSTPSVVSYTNDPSGSGCARNDASMYGWDPNGGTQFMQSGEVQYSIRFLSACLSNSTFKAGCGLKFVAGKLRSNALWFHIRGQQPDGILVNGKTLEHNTNTTRHTCWDDISCALKLEATYQGLREFVPRGIFNITVVHMAAVGGIESSNDTWGLGGVFNYFFTARLLSGVHQAVTLKISIAGVHFADVVVDVRKLVVSSIMLEDLHPVDVEVGTAGEQAPVPIWVPQHDGDPFTRGHDNWKSQPGMYLVALAPYELRFTAVTLEGIAIQNLTGWTADLRFAPGSTAQLGNSVLQVQQGLNASTGKYTSPEFTLPFTSVVFDTAEAVKVVRFRLYSNVGCRRLSPCDLLLTLSNTTTTVIATLQVSVRMMANTLSVIGSPSSSVHRGISVKVLPGTYDSNNNWLPDEYNEGSVYALLTESVDGITGRNGITLADTVGSQFVMHDMKWIALTAGAPSDTWGAAWELRTSQPCVECSVTMHSTSGLGPTGGADDPFVFTLTDETKSVVCSSRVVAYTAGSLSTDTFNITVTATTLNGIDTLWSDWLTEIDPVNDFLEQGGSVHTGLLSLKQRDNTGIIRAYMNKGTAVIENLYIELPEGQQEGVFRIRATAFGVNDNYQCTPSVTLVQSSGSQGIRRLSVSLVNGGTSLCETEGVLGCSEYITKTTDTLRLKVRYYNGTAEVDLRNDVTDEDITVKLDNDILDWPPCEGQCATNDVELKSSRSPITGNGIELSQGSAIVRFERQVTNGRSAPQGYGVLSIVQQKTRGYTTPVREAVFEICDAASARGEFSLTSAQVPCRKIKLWIRPVGVELLQRHVAIVETSLTGTTLRPGAPNCGNLATKIELSAAMYHVWGNARYVMYDVPFDFVLSHGSDQELVSSVSDWLPSTSLTLSNKLNTSMTSRQLLYEGHQQVRFTFYGLNPKPPGFFIVSATDRTSDQIVPIPASTTQEYSWPAQSTETYPFVEVLGAPMLDDECPPSRRMPRAKNRYKMWDVNPGQEWSYGSDKAAMVGMPFPVQVQIQTADRERGWAFMPSPVVLRSKFASSGCNSGGNVTVYNMKVPPQNSPDLPGSLAAFEEVATQAVVTSGGQATLWFSMSAPCQECVLELALCYQNTLLTGLDTCHTLGGTLAEEASGPMVGKRTITTKPFSVFPLQTRSMAIVKQSIPEQLIISVGTPFSVTIEPAFEFEGEWLMDIPVAFKKKHSTVIVYAEARVAWVDSSDSISNRLLRYGNGGFLVPGASKECTTAQYTELSSKGTRMVAIRQMTPYELSLPRDSDDPWMQKNLEFSFVRPCSRCEVWVEAILEVDGKVVSQWVTRLYESLGLGAIAVYQVKACGVKWIWGGSPPAIVGARRPFSLTAFRADSSNIPSWDGQLSVSAGKANNTEAVNGGGGSLVFTSPLETLTPPSTTSVDGSVTFRMVATRSCFECHYQIGGVHHTLAIHSNATQIIAIPKSPPEVKLRDTSAVSKVWVYEVYAADDLGDRAYIGGPTYVHQLPSYKQTLQQPLSIKPLGKTAQTSRQLHFLNLLSPSMSVTVVEESPTPEIIYGRYMFNGIPVDTMEGFIDQCPECGLPGVIAVTLSGSPNINFQLDRLVVGDFTLPINMLASGAPPVLRWSVPPSAVIFNDTSAITTWSGRGLIVRFLAIGAIPGTQRDISPANHTYHLSSIPFPTPPQVTFACNHQGSVKLGGSQLNWGEPYTLDTTAAVLDLTVVPFLQGDITASCTLSILAHESHPGAYRPYLDGEIHEQRIRMTLRPGLLLIPDTWKWEGVSINTPGTADVVVAAKTTFGLLGLSSEGRETSVSEQLLVSVSLVTSPLGCFTAEGPVVMTTSRGPVLEWVGVVLTTGSCQIQTVSGLPVGSSGSTFVESLDITANIIDRVITHHSQGFISGAAGDPTVVTGTNLTFVLHVVDAKGAVVNGDYNTVVEMTFRQCVECCKSQSSACVPTATIPVISLTARGGVIVFEHTFINRTGHVPWAVSFKVLGLFAKNHISEVAPFYVVVAAAKLVTTLSMSGIKHEALSYKEGDAVLPWVVGFPFMLHVTAADNSAPSNTPVGIEQGADAVVSFHPLSIPCISSDLSQYVWCSTCRLGGEWLGDNSPLWSSCLAPTATTNNINWGKCKLVPIAPCHLKDWTFRNGSEVMVLTQGTTELPYIVYKGQQDLVRVLISSDNLLRGYDPYVKVIALDMQTITKLSIVGDYVSKCNATKGDVKKQECIVVGGLFISPPPKEPIQDENQAWYTPDRGFMQFMPADMDPVGVYVLDVVVEVLDANGNVLRGDKESAISLRAVCQDPSASRRERFYFGKVSNDLSAATIVEGSPSAPPHVITAQRGRAHFARMGFHGYCSHTIIEATCITSSTIDTMNSCSGISVSTDPFEVGRADLVLTAPVFPPQPTSPQYDQPAMQIVMGASLCENFEKELFTQELRKAISAVVPLVISSVVVHAACNIPVSRVDSGIVGLDYDQDICCPGYQTPSAAPVFPPTEDMVTPTLPVAAPLWNDTINATAPAETTPGGLAASCDGIPSYHYHDNATHAGRCCSDTGTCIAQDASCFPVNITFSEAELLCSQKGLRLCAASEISSCCTSNCHGSESIWVNDIQPDNTVCQVAKTAFLVPPSSSGFDVLQLLGTLDSCVAACCAMGSSVCAGFSRASTAPAGSVNNCWLKGPGYASSAILSNVYWMHALYNSDTPSPVVPQEPVPCSQMDLQTCGATAGCVYNSSGAVCRDGVYCAADYHVISEECVLCPSLMTRDAGDEIGGGDTMCYGCDGVLDSNATLDACAICNGDNSTCAGCDGVPNSGTVLDPCGLCKKEQKANSSCGSCAVNEDVASGTSVLRGPDWVYGTQDVGTKGTVLSTMPCTGGSWVTVRWQPTINTVDSRVIENTNSYRAGCDGRYDLSVESCVAESCLYHKCSLAPKRDACEALGCSWDTACTGELKPHAACPCRAWSKTDCGKLGYCSWMGGVCAAADSSCPLDYHVSGSACVPCSPGTTNPAGDKPAGNDTTCFGCDGVRNSSKVIDPCNICGGDGNSCLGCDGVHNSGKEVDQCGVCGGDGSNCSSCVVTPSNAVIGMRVVRGRDWSKAGSEGTSVGWLKEKVTPCNGGFWYTVLWEDGSMRWYQVGCNGVHELAIDSCRAEICRKSDVCIEWVGEAACTNDPACEWAGSCQPTGMTFCQCEQVEQNCTGSCSWYGGSCNVDHCVSKPVCTGGDNCNMVGVCDKTTGLCPPATVLADGTACDDGNPLTLGDRCVQGVCTYRQICVDDATLLGQILTDAQVSGYVSGMSCGEALNALNLTCATSNWRLGSFSTACCQTCQAAQFHTRRVLQTAPVESTYLIVEIEVVLGAVHLYPEYEAHTVYSAVESAFAVGSFLCGKIPEKCLELDALCKTASYPCPMVKQISPVPRVKETPAPTIPVTPVPLRRPDALTPEEVMNAVSTVRASNIALHVVLQLCALYTACYFLL